MPKKKSSIERDSFSSMLSQTLTIYLANGTAITGKLVEFDEETLKLSGRTAEDPPSYIKLSHVTSYHTGVPPKRKRQDA